MMAAVVSQQQQQQMMMNNSGSNPPAPAARDKGRGEWSEQAPCCGKFRLSFVLTFEIVCLFFILMKMIANQYYDIYNLLSRIL